MRWLVAYAKEQGAGKIYLETSNMAKELYKELGFVKMQDMMVYGG